MPIPRSVTLTELTAALQPLCDLLGTSTKNFYDSPGMSIGERCITFTVPALHDEDPAGRSPALRAANHPQGDAAFGELAYVVRVEVDVDR